MTSSTHGIRSVLTAATVGVAVLALAIAALLTAPIVSGSVEKTARESLARDADLVSRLPQIERFSERPRASLQQVVRRGLSLGIITATGESTGVATVLTADQRAQVLSGNAVSGSGDLDGIPVLVEARPLGNGAAVVLGVRSDDVRAAVTAQRRRLLLALAFGLLVAVGVGVLVSGRLGRPLAALAATARRLSSGERGIAEPASDQGPREVAEVATALHLLDAQLVASEDRQRRFLLSVSHELRTPLTTIRGYAESLVDGAVEPEQAPAVGATMLAESLRLERYVADLLSLARLEADDFGVDLGDVDVARVLADGAAAWSDRVARADLSLEVEAPDGLIAHTDAGRVRQVLDILTDNAVRVCPPGSRIIWSAGPRPDAVRLEVRDSGPGLTDPDAPPTGLGLGLAIARRLVTRLGGSITLTRAPEGGAAFVIDLPGHHV